MQSLVMNDEIRKHCAEINRCNQRGGRMLSIVDLIEAGTISRDLAAYSMSAIGSGASFLVGAMPGGAGKTTVMGALLNFVPPEVQLVPADGMDIIESGIKDKSSRCCYICHEIGSGWYYAYLWGESLRAYFNLPKAGHMLATNLHADTYTQAREQICGDNEVAETALRKMNLMFFLSVRRKGGQAFRRIEQVWESDGQSPHRQVFAADSASSPIESSQLVSREAHSNAQRIIDKLIAQDARTIEQSRAMILKMDGKDG